jgi:glycerol kinase
MADNAPIILAIDQGSGSTKALAIDTSGNVLAQAEVKIITTFPQVGWVEQDPEEIWQSVVTASKEITSAYKIAAVGLSIQRESVLLWDRKTGKALSKIITWQDRRASELAAKQGENAAQVRAISGLELDPMFSALKTQWLFENNNYQSNDICIGTIDSWIAFKLGAGHIVEAGSASRTQLLDIKTGQWSPKLLSIFAIDKSALPRVCPSNEKHICTNIQALGLSNDVPLSGIMGDSHAALFAHQGWKDGCFKATFGTGTSLMGLTKTNPQTIAWQIDDEITEAAEANILSTGSTLVWLAELLGTTPDELAKLAPESTQVVELVPAFNGLGAPWWDREATGIITGLTRGSSRADLAAAALRSTAAQINDVLEDFAKSNIKIETLYADGGGARNQFLMQMLADLSGKKIKSSQLLELSAFGAAMVAALGAGLSTLAELEKIELRYDEYLPKITEPERQERLKTWRKALAASRMKDQ